MSHALKIHDGLGEIAVDPSLGILLAYGNTVPSAAAVGYAPGCIFIQTDGTSLATTTYINTGTKASASFVSTLASPALTTPDIGVATGTSIAVTGLISSASPSAGIGYITGSQATAVVQITNRSTGVTANGICGKITTTADSIAAQTSVTFVVTNSSVDASDTVIVNVRSGPTGLKTIAAVATVAAGSFHITLFNTDATTGDTGAAIINFAVIKAVDV